MLMSSRYDVLCHTFASTLIKEFSQFIAVCFVSGGQFVVIWWYRPFWCHEWGMFHSFLTRSLSVLSRHHACGFTPVSLSLQQVYAPRPPDRVPSYLQRERLARLQPTYPYLPHAIIDLPPTIPLSDGEEPPPYQGPCTLQLRDPEQQLELNRESVRAPPNRTVFDSPLIDASLCPPSVNAGISAGRLEGAPPAYSEVMGHYYHPASLPHHTQTRPGTLAPLVQGVLQSPQISRTDSKNARNKEKHKAQQVWHFRRWWYERPMQPSADVRVSSLPSECFPFVRARRSSRAKDSKRLPLPVFAFVTRNLDARFETFYKYFCVICRQCSYSDKHWFFSVARMQIDVLHSVLKWFLHLLARRLTRSQIDAVCV